jgi:DNA (cytosine-5)-methyltransferase 1
MASQVTQPSLGCPLESLTAGPRLLDLFCGAGGAGMGYHRAGFDVTGVDIKPQPRYPFRFVQADALEYLRAHGHEYDAVHASPPCQAYSVMRSRHRHITHPRLYEATRDVLRAVCRLWVIENVIGAPADHAIVLCGATFGLRVYRHRSFESSHLLLAPPHGPHLIRCARQGTRARPDQFVVVTGNCCGVAQARLAMGIDWMVRDELSQAIPPAYTEFIGRQLLPAIQEGRAL